jgi:hypothetical protein
MSRTTLLLLACGLLALASVQAKKDEAITHK